MKVAEYIAKTLASLGASDAFGIPGGVMLDLLYAFDQIDGIVPHLSYHEQSAGFAACGYAQSSGKLGVVYSTRGPGFTNLLTPMADAYYDSLPVLFVTAHAADCPPKGMRSFNDQEMDTCAMVESITKFAARIDSPIGFASVFNHAIQVALDGRKGPVFLDVKSSVLSSEIDASKDTTSFDRDSSKIEMVSCIRELASEVSHAKRPVVLIGDGIDRIISGDILRDFATRCGLPFLSSRFSHDLLAGHFHYYGYVGSHGIRAANFILSKADFIVAVGNRLNFPVGSESFSPIIKRARIVRIDTDKSEFSRPITNCRNLLADSNEFLRVFSSSVFTFPQFTEWLAVCDRLRSRLAEIDVNVAVEKLRTLLNCIAEDAVVVSDVGNCEFWLSQASVLPGKVHRTLYSKSFGALGCGIGKAIGAYYATRKPIVCVVGDQGLLMNLQELQYVAQHHLPITFVLLDNRASGMICDVEKRRFDYLLHVTSENGFWPPQWDRMFEAFGITDFKVLNIPCDLALTPNLPHGNSIQNLDPPLPLDIYTSLNEI